MKSFIRVFASLGIAGCLLVPAFADAKPAKEKVCKLNSQEFVLFEMDISQKLLSLQEDLIASNVDNQQVKNALKSLVDAYQNLYADLGRQASMSDKFVYTSDKLDALNNAAMDYYSTVYYLLRNRNNHLIDAYKVVEATKTAANEFSSQCNKSSKRSKNWFQKWNNINSYTEYKDPVNRPGFTVPTAPAANNPAPAANKPNNAPNNGPANPWNNNAPNNHPGSASNNHPGSAHNNGPAGGWHPNHPQNNAKRAMDSGSFNSLYNSVSAKNNSDQARQVSIEAAISGGNYFNCDQMASLLKPYDFDFNRINAANKLIDAAAGTCTSDQVIPVLKAFQNDTQRVSVAVKIYDIVSDKNNWFKIYDTFDFPSSRQSVESQIRNK